MNPKQSSESHVTQSSQTIFRYFLIVFLLTIFLVGKVLWPFFSILILGFVLTGIFYPLYTCFGKLLSPIMSSILTCSIIFLVIFLPLVFFVGALSKEAYNLYLMGTDPAFSKSLRELLQHSHIVERIESILSNYNIKLGTDQLNAGLSEIGRTVGLFLYQQANAIVSNAFNFLVNFAFMLLIIFFLFIDGEKLIQFIVDLSPLPEDQDRKLMSKFHEMAAVVLVVNGISGLIQGILGGVAFAIFGLSSPLLWGFIMAVLAFFPIVGIGVVLIPTSILLFLKGKIGSAIFFLVFYILLSGIVEYLLKPKLVGNKVQIHTLLVFLAVLGGLKVFGILGIIYGPLVITAFLTLTDIYRSSYEMYIRNS